MQKSYDNENGRSMIEMLGVLAIIGVLSVGGIAGYSKAMMRYRVNKTIDQITYMAGNIHTFFAPQKNYRGLNEIEWVGCSNFTVMKKAKLVPDEMWEEDKDYPQSIFGSNVGIDEYCSDDVCYGFTIILNNIPEEACIEIVTHDWQPLNLFALEVGDGDAALGRDCYYDKEGWEDDDAIYSCIYDHTYPISLERAILGCSENAAIPGFMYFFFR